ncbi:MAG: dioxygenase, partial [Rhizobiaceae bacterium]|nr:dioxygenase [Rhizobiaceae bacterium]
GSPARAEKVFHLLEDAGLSPRRRAERGYDHGTWTPLKLAFPEADIPVVQVSIDPTRDAAWHYRLGLALAPLRHEGVLIIGSGHITHNLRAFFSVVRQGAAPDPALSGQIGAFTGWIADTLAAGDTDALLSWKQQAPFPAENHPTDEHLMPLFFAYGAAGEAAAAERLHRSAEFGFFVYESYMFR